MSRFKILLMAAFLVALVALVLATGSVSAGDPDGGGHGIIQMFLV